MKDAETNNPWQTLHTERIYQNSWIEIEHHDVLTPAGNPGIYGIVKFKNLAIGIIPLDKDNNTWIVGQYRYPHKKYSWEIPEGGGPIGIDPIDSAKRELLEECGIIANNWELILEMDLSNSATDERALLYVARELSFTHAEPEETEDLQVKKIPFSQLFQMVMEGSITDAMTVGAVLKLQLLLNSK